MVSSKFDEICIGVLKRLILREGSSFVMIDVSALQIDKIKLGKPLNPYAASFVPSSMRRTADDKEAVAVEITSRDGKTVQHQCIEDGNKDALKSHKETVHDQQTSVGIPINIEVCPQMVHGTSGSDGKVSQNPNSGAKKDSTVEDFEVELAYLVTQFPDLSEQSLADVYFANDGDLDASIEMLNQLEDEVLISLGSLVFPFVVISLMVMMDLDALRDTRILYVGY
ncbi:hypothetical protein ACLOJK_031853 [Asimina triloba]